MGEIPTTARHRPIRLNSATTAEALTPVSHTPGRRVLPRDRAAPTEVLDAPRGSSWVHLECHAAVHPAGRHPGRDQPVAARPRARRGRRRTGLKSDLFGPAQPGNARGLSDAPARRHRGCGECGGFSFGRRAVGRLQRELANSPNPVHGSRRVGRDMPGRHGAGYPLWMIQRWSDRSGPHGERISSLYTPLWVMHWSVSPNSNSQEW